MTNVLESIRTSVRILERFFECRDERAIMKITSGIALMCATLLLGACAGQPFGKGSLPNVEISKRSPVEQEPDNSLPGETAAAQATAVSNSTPTTIDRFPSSALPAKGKPWQVVHESGYTGGADEACKLMYLSGEQCKLIKSVTDCEQVEIPNGTVLDDLTFTARTDITTRTGTKIDKGTHLAQNHVLVEIKKGSSRAYLCNAGGGVYVGRVFECGNYFRINTKAAQHQQHAAKHKPAAPHKAAAKASTKAAKESATAQPAPQDDSGAVFVPNSANAAGKEKCRKAGLVYDDAFGTCTKGS